MPFTIAEFRDLLRILEEQPEWRAELRRLLGMEELLGLPSVVRELAAAQKATERQLGRLTECLEHLAEQVQALVTWQRGEAGRREGERYERNVARRAPVLFRGGIGGATDSPEVQQRLSKWLGPLLRGEGLLEADEDPTLSDLIWWKGERVAVVEVSLKVNGDDVRRAWRRAGTLQSAGIEALPVVVGEDWANLEVREWAGERGVEWIVGGIPSEGLLAFRRLLPEG
jgi:hypothetical protein